MSDYHENPYTHSILFGGNYLENTDVDDNRPTLHAAGLFQVGLGYVTGYNNLGSRFNKLVFDYCHRTENLYIH